MAREEAPIHAKLAAHRENPSVEKLTAIVDEHHQQHPPAFVWADDLLAVLNSMKTEIDTLTTRLDELEGRV